MKSTRKKSLRMPSAETNDADSVAGESLALLTTSDNQLLHEVALMQGEESPASGRLPSAATNDADSVAGESLALLTTGDSQLLHEVALMQGEESPAPGRPKDPKDNILEGRRNDIALMLEKNWNTIGWDLERLRNRKKHYIPELRDALLPLNQELYKDRVALLLRPLTTPATSRDVRKTRNERAEVHKRIWELNPRITAQSDKCDEARRAVYEGSEENLKSLKQDITRRIVNRLQLTNEISSKEKQLQSGERSLIKLRDKNSNSPEFRQLHRDVLDCHADLERSRQVLQTENSLIRRMNQRIADVTKERVEFAHQELKRRQIDLDRLQKEAEELQREYQRLDMLWWDQASGFAQQDFLDFISEKRSDHDPRLYANAVAGLPEIGCRASAPRCKAIKFSRDCWQDQNYRVFEIIRRAWDKRESHRQISARELIQKEISRLPKSLPSHGKRIKNFDLDFFLTHTADLEQAVEYWETTKSQWLSAQMPYIVAAKFLENVYRERTIWERIGADAPLKGKPS